jgi:hypothetical protein
MSEKFIEFPFIPITKETFERQEWERHIETDGYDEEGNPITYTYYTLPLPKDNPEDECGTLISSADDDWEELKIKKGEFFVEIADFFGLGLCTNEEELEILYRILTKEEIE